MFCGYKDMKNEVTIGDSVFDLFRGGLACLNSTRIRFYLVSWCWPWPKKGLAMVDAH